MENRSEMRFCAVALGAITLLLLSTTSVVAQDFEPHGTVAFEYEESHEKRGSEKSESSTISQEYTLDFDGYIWRREFVLFQSSFSYSDTMGDDSDSGESRDRDVGVYDISADILPDWPTPMRVEVSKNIVIVNSDDALDTRSEEDTYRFEWQAVSPRFPKLNFEFERVDDQGEEIGAGLVTDDTQRDSYRFKVSETIFGRAQIQFDYERDEDRNNLEDTEDVSNAYVVTGDIEVSSNLRVDMTAEYRENENESSMVVSSVALREEVDFIAAFSFYDADLPVFNSIGDHIAIPLTSGGALDFSGWTPSGFMTTVNNVNNNEITFNDPIPSDDMVVIEYQTQDGTRYFDIYRGNDSADTFVLTVTQVFITERFDDYLVFARHVSIGGGRVTLSFTPLTSPEPIDSGPFPLQDVDVSIEYNTRSRSHIVDDFRNVDIEQSGTEFDLSRDNPGHDEERTFDIDISYLPTAALDLNFSYSFNEAENETEVATEHSWEAAMKYSFTERLVNATDVSYDRNQTKFKFNPDVDDPTTVEEETPLSENWKYSTAFEYSRPLRWADLDTSYEYEFDTSEDDGVSKSESTTHSADLDLTAGRTKGSTSVEHNRDDDKDLVTGESTWATKFSFDLSLENKRPFGLLLVSSSLGYEYEHDEAEDTEDITKNTYSIDEDFDYLNLSVGTSAEYSDEESGESWSKELSLDLDADYAVFSWLDLSAGTSWTKTKNELETSTNTDAFIDANIGFDIGSMASAEFGIHREWTWDDPGEDEKSFEFDAKFTCTYAQVKATLDFDYGKTEYNGDSENSEDYGFSVSVERDF